jgi:hypothetical protein
VLRYQLVFCPQFNFIAALIIKKEISRIKSKPTKVTIALLNPFLSKSQYGGQQELVN